MPQRQRDPIGWRIALVVLLAGLAPVAIGEGATQIYGQKEFVDEFVHTGIELAGSAIALTLAVLLLLRTRYEKGAEHLLWLAAGFVVMGVLDFGHGVMPFGAAWSWTRHIAAVFGGLFFGLVCIPVPGLVVRSRRASISAVALAAIAAAVGVAVWECSGSLPAPWGEGGYSFAVKVTNGLGGIGFLAAVGFFIRRYARDRKTEDLAFAGHALLFGVAAMLFGFSRVWGLSWWVWHGCRLVAYGVVLVVAYEMVASLYRRLEGVAQDLEAQVKERTAEVASVALFPLENPLPVLRAGPSGVLLFANRAAAEVMQYWGCNVGERVPERVAEKVAKAFNEGVVHEAEFEVGRKIFSFVMMPLRERAYVNLYVSDITELKRVQEELRQREQRLRLITDAMPALVSYIGRDERFQFANREYESWFGIQQGETVGRTMAEVMGEPTMQRLAPYVNQALSGQDVRFEIETPYLKGNVRWIQSHFVPDRDSVGTVRGFVVLVLDITERKKREEALRESEERFRIMADSTSLIIWVTDAEGRIRFVNRSFSSFFGTTLHDVEQGKWDLPVQLGDAGFYSKAYYDALRERKSFRVQKRVQRFDGAWRWMEFCGEPRFSTGGEFLGFGGSSADVTERRAFQEELERVVAERTAKLQELVAELEHFSYTITHDMRAPLRAMRGYADLTVEAADGRLDPESVGFLRRIQTAADRMDALITDALNYGKAVRQELLLGPVDAGALLRGMLDTYPEFQPSNAEIQIEGEIPPLLGNEAGLTQCFSNLLGNAVKFVKPGMRPKVRIRTELIAIADPPGSSLAQPRTHRRVRVWVEDEGIGIAKEMQPRLFRLFSRGHRDYEGTGVGLALVKKVVERMGGRVGVESTEGQGSRFWVELNAA